MFRYVAFVLAAGVATGFSTPAFADAGKVFDTLLSCRPDFFSVLKAEAPALGRVKLETFADPGNRQDDPDAKNVYAQIATFEKPVKAGDLSIVRYFQSATVQGGQPIGYSWALQIAEQPEVIIRLLESRFDAKFARPWMFEGWSVDVSQTPDAGPLSPKLTIAPYDDPDRQATLTCDVDPDATADMQPPDIRDLFGAP
ncbi:hypothetical protein [Sinorhizobium chiapasense]|uniref:Uncharacterized protein n=1 Tax=Sinorhizobium chiapasense TaxID=501572 RepID=A0ABZ2BDY4_9HYPH